MIHGDDDKGFVISSRGCWLPGIYASAAAARAAFQLDDTALARLTDAVCKREQRRITSDDLRAARRAVGDGVTPGTSATEAGKG